MSASRASERGRFEWKDISTVAVLSEHLWPDLHQKTLTHRQEWRVFTTERRRWRRGTNKEAGCVFQVTYTPLRGGRRMTAEGEGGDRRRDLNLP